jgi:hypothetical protein
MDRNVCKHSKWDGNLYAVVNGQKSVYSSKWTEICIQ